MTNHALAAQAQYSLRAIALHPRARAGCDNSAPMCLCARVCTTMLVCVLAGERVGLRYRQATAPAIQQCQLSRRMRVPGQYTQGAICTCLHCKGASQGRIKNTHGPTRMYCHSMSVCVCVCMCVVQLVLTKLRPGALSKADVPANIAVSTVSHSPLSRCDQHAAHTPIHVPCSTHTTHAKLPDTGHIACLCLECERACVHALVCL